KRCEDASHSKSTSCKIHGRRFCFAKALGVRARPRVAFRERPRWKTDTCHSWRRGRLGHGRNALPRRWITDGLDNLLDCVNHQLRFLDLNIVRAFCGDCVFGIWCKRRQRVLSAVPCPVQHRRQISGQRLPWTQVERLSLASEQKMESRGAVVRKRFFRSDLNWYLPRASRSLYIFRARASAW